MSLDIGQDLLEKIRKDFENTAIKPENAKYIARILKSVENGTATLDDLNKFSQGVGSRLANIINNNLTEDILPDGKMYYNIANTILTNTLKDNYDLVNSVATQVQKQIDIEQGLNINPIQAKFPAERVHGIVNGAADLTATLDIIKSRINNAVPNITASFADDFIAANASLKAKAGLKTKVIRHDSFGCCPWCKALAGSYDYSAMPKDIFKRHENCNCIVTYVTEKGIQNVWNKDKWVPSEEDYEKMKSKKANTGIIPPEEAKEKQSEMLAKVFTNEGKNAIW